MVDVWLKKTEFIQLVLDSLLNPNYTKVLLVAFI